ncbi:hypothetical protein [Chitinilyticum litopenaei]|uniref:hypothetical protein n=1 Tax=Chitinilyticum litopenaei TaxID=1121276 RepID=UPI0005BE7381|nr:hypothetical protein [Chitinilyticum litopenaei]
MDPRIYIAAGALVASAALGAAGAWLVRGWQKDASHAVEQRQLIKDKHTLELALEKQSGEIRAQSAAASAASAAGERARMDADSWRREAQRRADQIKRVPAANCDELLEKMWGAQ